jgi:dihydroxyacetone kinase-like protein
VTILADVLRDVCAEVQSHAGELNELDARAGDGDLGVTVASAATAVLELLPEVDGKPGPEILRSCGSAVARRAAGTSGTLVATALLRAGRDDVGSDDGPAADFAARLEAARAGIAERGKAELGEKTMLDALAPAAAAAAGADTVAGALRAAAEAAEGGARETASMHPRHGRAGWLAERSLGHEDAGARFVAVALDAAARSVEGSPGS